MEKENSYTNSLRKLSDEELINYAEKPDEYEEEAVMAAIWELQKRKIANKKALATLASIEENRVKTVEQPFKIIPRHQDELNLPVFYSKRAIRFFSIFFSTLFGGILLSINLNRIHKNREILYVMSFSLIYTYGIGVFATFYPEYTSYIALVMNLLGMFILEGIFWKRLIGNDLKYHSQPVWFALGIGLLIAVLLLWNMTR
jgi:hypothetical protein